MILSFINIFLKQIISVYTLLYHVVVNSITFSVITPLAYLNKNRLINAAAYDRRKKFN